MAMKVEDLAASQEMAAQVTAALGGNGIWGVEFFIGKDGVYFSELSPRPHDTGMATLAGTQNFSEFELHARAILGIPVTEIVLHRNGASAVVLASDTGTGFPLITGLESAALIPDSDFKIFNKPSTRPYRRMAVGLAYGNEPVSALVDRAKRVAACIKIESRD
jgi:phosphoribosylglycinamide formyltransferase 2